MKEVVRGTKIVLNEDKILSEDKYDLTEIYETIDSVATQFNFTKQDKYTYIVKNDKNALSNIGNFCWGFLMKTNWFYENVKEWLYLQSEEGNEDMIQYLRTREKIA